MLNTTPERSSKETFVTTFRRKTRRKRAILTSDSSATFCLFRITTRAKPVSETSKRNDQNIRLVSYSKQKTGDSTMPPNTMASPSKSSKVVMQLSPLAFQMEKLAVCEVLALAQASLLTTTCCTYHLLASLGLITNF